MFITVIASVFLLGVVSADTGNNTTNTTTSLNTTAVEPLASGIQISVTPTALNLGTVDPDGLERAYYSNRCIYKNKRRDPEGLCKGQWRPHKYQQQLKQNTTLKPQNTA